MNVSVLLRLIPAGRTGGRLAGQAELIETGETTVFSDHDEMLAFLCVPRLLAKVPGSSSRRHRSIRRRAAAIGRS